MVHKNFHTKPCMFTAVMEFMYLVVIRMPSESYCMQDSVTKSLWDDE